MGVLVIVDVDVLVAVRVGVAVFTPQVFEMVVPNVRGPQARPPAGIRVKTTVSPIEALLPEYVQTPLELQVMFCAPLLFCAIVTASPVWYPNIEMVACQGWPPPPLVRQT